MMKYFVPASVALSAILFCSGCVGLSFGGGSKNAVEKPTVGQQILDLQKARQAGAISEAEFQAQKAKVLQSN